MDIIYSNHAREKIDERIISKTIIENALKHPDTIINSKAGTRIAHKLIRDRLLRIIYRVEKKRYVVITVYYAHPERYVEEK